VWAATHRSGGLVVIGVHTPEFGFEHNVDNVITQSRRLDVVRTPIVEDVLRADQRAPGWQMAFDELAAHLAS
jgi:hypothetical protein